jgi:hypothetical protein
MDGRFGGWFVGSFCAWVVIIGLAGGLYGCPQYNVYQSRLAGEAELAQADYNRQIAVREAEAKKAAAQQLADAEVIRAGGVAKANQIIGDSLKGNDAYLRYLWITDVTGGKAPTVIYVPTEANIPILEAGKPPR